MLENFFSLLYIIDDLFWSYIGFAIIVLIGSYLTIKTKGFQFHVLFNAKKYIKQFISHKAEDENGIHPIRLYFASVGGMVGLGNLVGVVSCITIGGPGSIVWLWVASFAGMLIKYCEIYLGIKYRVKNHNKGYDGGPMYYLQAAFNNKSIPIIACILLAIYGVEVSQFLIITDTVTDILDLNRYLVIGILLILVLYAGLGGVKRLANINSMLMPGFMALYIIMCVWIVGNNFSHFLDMIPIIFKSAFTGHAALGGFVGSTMIIAAQYGMQRAVYSGDIGIGYDSIVQSETFVKNPSEQAHMAVFSLLTETIICTLTCLILLVTDTWLIPGLKPSEYTIRALALYFPHIDLFILVMFFIAGFTTIIGYFVIGMKAAKFLSQDWGQRLYILYAIVAFIIFSFYDQARVMLLMTVSGGFLMTLNICGIMKLRNEIKFK